MTYYSSGSEKSCRCDATSDATSEASCTEGSVVGVGNSGGVSINSYGSQVPSLFFSPVGRETLKVIYYTLGGDEAQEGGAASSVRVQVQVAKVLGEVDSAKK